MAISKEKTEEIIAKYQTGNYSCGSLQEIYGIKRQTIYSLLRRNNILLTSDLSRHKRYTLNENAFSNLNSQESLYFLGFLYADGTLLEKTNNVKIYLQEPDVHILESFKKFLDKPLYLRRKSKENHQNMRGLDIYSATIFQDLTRYGLMQNKTFKLTFPDFIPDDVLHHFVRGVLDGDGTISVHGANILGTLEFLTGLNKALKRILDVSLSIIIPDPKRPPNNIRVGSIGGRHKLMKFLNWIFKDSSIYLHRKYNMYLGHIEYDKYFNNVLYPEPTDENGNFYSDEQKIENRRLQLAERTRSRRNGTHIKACRSLIHEDGTPWSVEEKRIDKTNKSRERYKEKSKFFEDFLCNLQSNCLDIRSFD